MFLQPKKTKHKKLQKGVLRKSNLKNSFLLKGFYGLKAQESGSISAKQLEAARQAIARKMKKKGKIWVRVWPRLPITRKPNETRMGKGKGAVHYWVSRITNGNIIFELSDIPHKAAITSFRTGAAKLPVKTKVIKRERIKIK